MANKVITHPDKEEIIKWITSGVPVREIQERLRSRYPKRTQKHLRISHSTIQNFKTDHLNIKGKVLEDIKSMRSNFEVWARKDKVQKELESSSEYQKVLMKAAEDEIDVRNELMKIFTVIESRIEILFNKVSESDISIKEEKVLQGYLDQFMKVLDQHKKYVEGFKETTEHNVNINIVNDQVTVIRDAIRETIAELDPGMALEFMSRLSTKMNELASDDEGNIRLLTDKDR